MECWVDCYDGKTSRKQQQLLRLTDEQHVTLVSDDGETRYRVQDLVVSRRLGRTARQIEMPDGVVCEVSDNDAVDRLLAASGSPVPGRLVDRLESRLRYVVIACLLTGLFLWGAISYGIPQMARHVADLVPVAASTALGDDVLEVLDKTLFDESRLDEAEKNNARALFARMTPGLAPGYRFELVFRSGERIGANAFALPTGTIVVTDELIKAIEHPGELESILAHEVGHVVQRHSLRQLIQGSTIALIMMAVTGDISAVAAMSGALPVLLTETYYSREFEREADQYAYDHLHARGISPQHFVRILERIAGSGETIGFLSTHPSVDERLQIFSR